MQKRNTFWDDRLVVVEQAPNTGEVIRKLFTGSRFECHEVMRLLLRKGWPLDRLSLIDEQVGRHCSFVL